jgi:FkbM family methyltransferase
VALSDLVHLATNPMSADPHAVTLRPFVPKANRGPFGMGAIATTEVCNLSCVFCHFNGPKAIKKSKQLEPELVQKTLKDLPPGSQIYFAATGELFMDEHAADHLRAAVELGLAPLVLSHGQGLCPDLLEQLLTVGVRHFRMSCDAIEAKAYAKIRRGGELQRILDAASYLRERKAAFPEITTEINCTLLSNTFHRQEGFVEFWRGKVDAINFNAEYFATFRFRNIHFAPSRRVDCQLQTYVLPSGKITPCCAMMVYAHDNDVSWLPDIRTHSLQAAHDELCEMYEDPASKLSAICRQCDWWILWARNEKGDTPYLRCVPLNERTSLGSSEPNSTPLISIETVGVSEPHSVSGEAMVSGGTPRTNRKDPFQDQRMLLSRRSVNSILDVGSNIGDTTAVYRSLFPEAVIYGFEPFPPAFDQYCRRFQRDRLVRPVRLAAAREAGTAQLYVNQNNVTNSCLPAAEEARSWAERAGDIELITSLQVSSTTVDDFRRQNGIGEIQILKMDIQGGELRALEGATESLSQGAILLVYTELLFVPLYEAQAFFYEVAMFLSRYGYTLFDVYNGTHDQSGQLKWADGLFLSPQVRASQINAKRSTSSMQDPSHLWDAYNQPTRSTSNQLTYAGGCGRTTTVSSSSGVALRGHSPTARRELWDRSLRARRPAITDDGFDMPGFAGHYYMWPEEYSLLSKYVDLTQGDYLEIGSMCGIIAISFATRYPQRSFYCIDAFCPGYATIGGNKQAFLENLRNHNLRNVTLLEEDSRTAVPKIGHRFEIALIDANHAYEYVLADALNTWPLLAPGGFMAFHDYGCVEETTSAVEDFLSQTGARLVEVASGLAVVCKPSQPAAKEEQPDETTELRSQIAALERHCATLNQEKSELETMLQAIQGSAGWRLLNSWRRVRDRIVPPASFRRKVYDSVIGTLRGRRSR